MVRALVLSMLLVLAGCGGFRKLGGRSGAELSYAQVQAIQPGLSATQVIEAFGSPGRERRGPDGKIQVLDYAALDAQNGHARLVLGFDAREVLVEKGFTGGVLKP